MKFKNKKTDTRKRAERTHTNIYVHIIHQSPRFEPQLNLQETLSGTYKTSNH